MIGIDRHIEILLLSNDCVIVPDLGGFVTHHIEARFDETEQLFLPPQRTLGFNPQLRMNDSLLAQSYIEAYDISYPEALRRIEAEVNELKQHLTNEGSYTLNDIGVLSVNEEGNLEFEPCEAGLLTPELYGLSSFEMMPLGVAKVKHIAAAEETTEPLEKAVVIKMSWLRNTVAIAAALLAFILLTPSVSNSDSPSHVSMSQITLPLLQKGTSPKTVEKAVSQPEKKVEEKVVPQEEPIVSKPATEYCIVVASQVSQRNADAFVQKLQSKGYHDARVYLNNNIRRVVIGTFESEADAYQQLHSVHRHEDLADAWVYKIRR